MQEEDDESPSTEENPPPRFPAKAKPEMNPTKSLVRFQTHRLSVCDERIESPTLFQGRFSSPSKIETRTSKYKPSGSDKEARIVDGQNSSDCWKSNSSEVPLEFVELYKEEEDWTGRPRRRRLEDGALSRDTSGGALEALSYTKEFHVLNEIQKARILTAIEDTIKKLANTELKDFGQQEDRSRCPETASHEGVANVEKVVCRKFLLPWVLMKVLEMIICQIIQLIFLSNDSYFQRKSEFLPVVVTFYLTLFIITFSLLIHIICFSYAGVQHPCYFMCIVSSSILILTTGMGIMIMLCAMDYYQTFRQILVLVFIGILLSCLVVELCICYFEVKSFWNREENTELFLA